MFDDLAALVEAGSASALAAICLVIVLFSAVGFYLTKDGPTGLKVFFLLLMFAGSGGAVYSILGLEAKPDEDPEEVHYSIERATQFNEICGTKIENSLETITRFLNCSGQMCTYQEKTGQGSIRFRASFDPKELGAVRVFVGTDQDSLRLICRDGDCLKVSDAFSNTIDRQRSDVFVGFGRGDKQCLEILKSAFSDV